MGHICKDTSFEKLYDSNFDSVAFNWKINFNKFELAVKMAATNIAIKEKKPTIQTPIQKPIQILNLPFCNPKFINVTV